MRKLNLIALAIMALTPPALAQDYPTRTITMVVPYPAGGPSDVVARIVADGMSKRLGQTIIIENVGGAGGTIGTARVAAAEPDGYTLLGASMGSHVAAPAFYPNLMWNGRFSAPSGDPFNNSKGFLFPPPEGATRFPPNDPMTRSLLPSTGSTRACSPASTVL